MARKTKLEALREDAKNLPADYPEGVATQRLPVGDALYCTWLLGNMRMVGCARYGVSEVVHALGSDEALAEQGHLLLVERWKVNQVALYYWAELLDFMIATNPDLAEADVAPARSWATCRRSSFYWYLGAAAEGALLYDAFEDLLFVVKGHISAIPFLLEQMVAPGSGAPLLRKRVVIGGLSGRADLNGEKALATYHDEAAGRYAVLLESTGEAVRVKAANLQLVDAAAGYAPRLVYATLLPFEGAIVYDGVIVSAGEAEPTKPWAASFARAWTEGPGKSWAADVNEQAAELRGRAPVSTLLPAHALLHATRWRGGTGIAFGPHMPSALRDSVLRMPGELDFVPPADLGPTSATPEAANDRGWWNGD